VSGLHEFSEFAGVLVGLLDDSGVGALVGFSVGEPLVGWDELAVQRRAFSRVAYSALATSRSR
jgi:hypothetical protein